MRSGRLLMTGLLLSILAAAQSVDSLTKENKSLEATILALKKTVATKRADVEKKVASRKSVAAAKIATLKKRGCDPDIDTEKMAGVIPTPVPEELLSDPDFSWSRDGKDEKKLQAHKAALEEIQKKLDLSVTLLDSYADLSDYMLKMYEGTLDKLEKACGSDKK
jgi:hypothetical protein